MDASIPPPSSDLREHAAQLLAALAAVASLGIEDARRVVDVMVPAFVAAGTLVIKEGDAKNNDFMMLVLEGDVRAENVTPMPGEEVVISVIGPGHLIGEMGVIDNAPRSARCTAITDLKLAVLSREALLKLTDTHPSAAARLLFAVSHGLAERLRDANRRLRGLAQVNHAMLHELDATHAVNKRLLDNEDSRHGDSRPFDTR